MGHPVYVATNVLTIIVELYLKVTPSYDISHDYEMVYKESKPSVVLN
jgi:hypothetical protein